MMKMIGELNECILRGLEGYRAMAEDHGDGAR